MEKVYIEERIEKLETENLELKRRIEKLENIVFQKEILKEKNIKVLKEREYQVKASNNQITMDEDEIFKKLKGVRLSLAKKEGIPPFYIFGDKTLKEMVEKLPTTEWEFLELNGIGDKKLEKYGHIFIEAIKKIKNNEDINIDGCIKLEKSVLRPAGVMKSHIITHGHYSDGYGLQEIASIRKLTPYTIARELMQCKDEGLDVELRSLIEETKLNLILESYKLSGGNNDNFKERLPKKIKPYEIMVALYEMK